jgi:hypothetical protein
MQIILKSILLALAMALANLFLPWWGFTLLAVGSAWICQYLKDSMLVAASASVLSWVPLLIYSYVMGGDILFNRVSTMMGLSYPFLLILSSGILVALLGALAGFCGFYLKELIHDN